MDTICSVATAVGESAIGIIRISGMNTLDVLNAVFAPEKSGFSTYVPWHFYYGHVVDNDEVVDEGLAVFFKGPKSYTREDMAEIHCHGGMVALKNVYRAVLKAGCRQSEPGEFTKRAFINGRLDLSQAESIMDIIQAKTELAFKNAVNQLGGSLSAEILELRKELLRIVTHLTVNIDYPEEDIIEITYDEIEPSVLSMKGKLETLLACADRGKILRDGVKTALIGRPNVGKSSLMNALLQEERAIVTNIPGTTRDVIEEYLNVRGIPVRLMDTAGVRDTEDIVERIGVDRTRGKYRDADLVLTVLDVSEVLTDDDINLLKDVSDKQVIVVLNKVDLESRISIEEVRNLLPHSTIIRTSAVKDIGLPVLEDAIERMVMGGKISAQHAFVVNQRHRLIIEEAYNRLCEVQHSLADRMPYDFIEIDLRNIYDSLGMVTGDTVTEELLDSVFSQFCIGK